MCSGLILNSFHACWWVTFLSLFYVPPVWLNNTYNFGLFPAFVFFSLSNQKSEAEIFRRILMIIWFEFNPSEDNKCCSNFLSLQFCYNFQEHCSLQSSVLLWWWTWLCVYRNTNLKKNWGLEIRELSSVPKGLKIPTAVMKI